MRKLLIIYTILAFCFSTVSALQISTPTLSGDRNANISTSITVTNDGSTVVSNLQFASSADSRYSIRFDNIPGSIAPGSSAVVTVKGFIPKDFDSGKKSIGTITVSAGSVSSSNSSNPFTTHNLTPPQNQTPQQVSIPVGMSATSDCGTNTDSPTTPIIGQWHVGSCDWVSDIEVKQPFVGSSDAGWARLHSDKLTDYWISTIAVDCNGQAQSPPNNWLFGGKIHSGPGICDGQIELPSADSGWVGFYTNPSADGKLILVVAEDKCGGVSQNVPSTGIVLGKVSTGPNQCNGVSEAVSYNNVSLDAGAMYIVYLPFDKTPQNGLPVGVFESLSNTSISGWAYDSDAPSISVDVFVDGSFWKTLNANLPRQDLVSSNKTPDANHGFSYSFTSADLAALDVSKNHTFHVYAINSPQGDNPLLNGSPKLLAAFVNYTPSINTTNTTNSSNNNTTNSTNGGNPSATTTASATLYMEAKDRLIIDRVKISCDKLESVNEGTTINHVLPGQTCQLTVRIKNQFNDNTQIEDVQVEADPENSDVDGDTDDISNIDAGDTEEVTLELQVDENADDGKVNVKITADGRDENGAQHSDELNFKLNIERLKHDLPITKITVNPSQAKPCETSRVDVTVYVENKGKHNEDKVAVELSVPGLSFVKKVTDLSIDQDEEERVTFSVPLSSNSPSGSFKATAKSFFDNVGESQSKTADLVIVKCQGQNDVVVVPPSQSNQDFQTSPVSDPVVVPPPRVDDIVFVPPSNSNSQNGTSFFDSALFTGILVMANLLALTVLGVMSYGYFRKPKDPMAEQFEDDKPVEVNAKDYY